MNPTQVPLQGSENSHQPPHTKQLAKKLKHNLVFTKKMLDCSVPIFKRKSQPNKLQALICNFYSRFHLFSIYSKWICSLPGLINPLFLFRNSIPPCHFMPIIFYKPLFPPQLCLPVLSLLQTQQLHQLLEQGGYCAAPFHSNTDNQSCNSKLGGRGSNEETLAANHLACQCNLYTQKEHC